MISTYSDRNDESYGATGFLGVLIRSVYFCNIMIDEVNDIVNISQLTLCIRWVDNDLDCLKDFIGLHSFDVDNAATIVTVVKNVS